TVTITAIQPRLRLSGTNRLGFQPSMAISVGFVVSVVFFLHEGHTHQLELLLPVNGYGMILEHRHLNLWPGGTTSAHSRKLSG
ncbi:MAG: hypothetical protein KZQ65_03700, partial [Candidatus Thiodiazotropha sp. (ex Gloverina cf. vestifex)]|nr:hypothetical protein [Candidatus Thiodiazotropha sp. (ex Gloverina cf. vestifex)]